MLKVKENYMDLVQRKEESEEYSRNYKFLQDKSLNHQNNIFMPESLTNYRSREVLMMRSDNREKHEALVDHVHVVKRRAQEKELSLDHHRPPVFETGEENDPFSKSTDHDPTNFGMLERIHRKAFENQEKGVTETKTSEARHQVLNYLSAHRVLVAGRKSRDFEAVHHKKLFEAKNLQGKYKVKDVISFHVDGTTHWIENTNENRILIELAEHADTKHILEFTKEQSMRRYKKSMRNIKRKLKEDRRQRKIKEILESDKHGFYNEKNMPIVELSEDSTPDVEDSPSPKKKDSKKALPESKM